VISAVYGLRAVAKIFFGQPTAQLERYHARVAIADLSWNERLPSLVLLAALFLFGFWPQLITGPLNETLLSLYPAVETVVRAAAGH